MFLRRIIMKCLERIRQQELLAATFNIGLSLKPLFAAIKEGLGLLHPILIKLREDASAEEDLKDCIDSILDKGYCAAVTFNDMLKLIKETPDNTCDRTSIVAIAQPMIEIMSAIEHILHSMGPALEYCEHLKSAIIKNTKKREEK
ncbi:MAG: hypothetical protein ACD_56C00012G0014 [uncultured bacterium]|nr:MAG: hypothetical protein ACD_56C00012G0014 [uncultured bacterium]